MMNNSAHNSALILDVTRDHVLFLKMEAKDTKDERRKFMLNFIVISKNFCLFFEAM